MANTRRVGTYTHIPLLFNFTPSITVLSISGQEVAAPKNQLEVARLADCAIDLYAMTAVLSRASRAYCIGLKNAVHEVCYTSTKLYLYYSLFSLK